jgi:hypothetical protein
MFQLDVFIRWHSLYKAVLPNMLKITFTEMDPETKNLHGFIFDKVNLSMNSIVPFYTAYTTWWCQFETYRRADIKMKQNFQMHCALCWQFSSYLYSFTKFTQTKSVQIAQRGFCLLLYLFTTEYEPCCQAAILYYNNFWPYRN